MGSASPSGSGSVDLVPGAYPCGEEAALRELGTHKYIVTLYDSFVYTDEVTRRDWDVLAITLCGGGTLFEYRASTLINEPIARYFFYQIVTALAYMHSRGIAHMDLRLENCMLDNNGEIKVCDFGNAMRFDPRALHATQEEFPELNDYVQAGTLAGTLSHMPPEMFDPERPFSATKVDVWYCGLILYELLMARPAFSIQRGSEEQDYAFSRKQPSSIAQNSRLIGRICRLEYEPVGPEFTREARNLVESMLAADPADRPTPEEILAHPWLKMETLKPAIAKGLVVLDPAPDTGRLQELLYEIFKAEDICAKTIESASPENSPFLLRLKCRQMPSNMLFGINVEMISSAACEAGGGGEASHRVASDSPSHPTHGEADQPSDSSGTFDLSMQPQLEEPAGGWLSEELSGGPPEHEEASRSAAKRRSKGTSKETDTEASRASGHSEGRRRKSHQEARARKFASSVRSLRKAKAPNLMQSTMGVREIENTVIRDTKTSDDALKVSFYLRHGILWEFQSVFRRIRFALLKGVEPPSASAESGGNAFALSGADNHEGRRGQEALPDTDVTEALQAPQGAGLVGPEAPIAIAAAPDTEGPQGDRDEERTESSCPPNPFVDESPDPAGYPDLADGERPEVAPAANEQPLYANPIDPGTAQQPDLAGLPTFHAGYAQPARSTSASGNRLRHGTSFSLAGEARNRELYGLYGKEGSGQSASTGDQLPCLFEMPIEVPSVPAGLSFMGAEIDSHGFVLEDDREEQERRPSLRELMFQFAEADREEEQLLAEAPAKASEASSASNRAVSVPTLLQRRERSSGTPTSALTRVSPEADAAFPAGQRSLTRQSDRRVSSLCIEHRRLHNPPTAVCQNLQDGQSLDGQPGQHLQFSSPQVASVAGDLNTQSPSSAVLARVPSFDSLASAGHHSARGAEAGDSFANQTHDPKTGHPRDTALPVRGAWYDQAGNRNPHVSQYALRIPEHRGYPLDPPTGDWRRPELSLRRSPSMSSLCGQLASFRSSCETAPGKACDRAFLGLRPFGEGQVAGRRGSGPEGAQALPEQMRDVYNVRQHVLDDQPVVEPVNPGADSVVAEAAGPGA